jgi:hypothetical protein
MILFNILVEIGEIETELKHIMGPSGLQYLCRSRGNIIRKLKTPVLAILDGVVNTGKLSYTIIPGLNTSTAIKNDSRNYNWDATRNI